MPVLARLQSEYGDEGLRVLAVNIDSKYYALEEWVDFMNRYEPKEVPDFAESAAVQDVNDQAIRRYELNALGTEVLVDRQGLVAMRSDAALGYGKLSSEIEKLLQ